VLVVNVNEVWNIVKGAYSSIEISPSVMLIFQIYYEIMMVKNSGVEDIENII
jgi:hypothetical protein